MYDVLSLPSNFTHIVYLLILLKAILSPLLSLAPKKHCMEVFRDFKIVFILIFIFLLVIQVLELFGGQGPFCWVILSWHRIMTDIYCDGLLGVDKKKSATWHITRGAFCIGSRRQLLKSSESLSNYIINETHSSLSFQNLAKVN